MTVGQYYRREDYAGFWRRLMVDLIDGLAIGFVCIALLVISWDTITAGVLMLAWSVILFAYFVLLKRSAFGTLGYRLGGIKVVGMDGQRASLFALTLRLFFMALGPLNYFADLLWLPDDPHRQALRDKFAQTYVVKKGAEAIGSSKVIHRYYEILGFNFLFLEIETVKSSAAGM